MQEIPAWPASSCSASVSTLPNVMSGLASDAASKTGPNCLHGPHHSAQKSTRTMPSPVTVSSKDWAVSSRVLMGFSLRGAERGAPAHAAQRPVNSGDRFSMKAFGPSLASSEAKTAAPMRASSAQHSSSCLPSDPRMVASTAWTASGPFAAMSVGELVRLRQRRAVGDDVADQAVAQWPRPP